MKRKHDLLRTAALFLSALLLLLGGCTQHGGGLDVEEDPHGSDVQEGQETGPALTMDCLSEIGKTFDLIREENPGIEYQTIDIPDASGQCLGQAQGQFLYYFFGTQGGPSLTDLSEEYGQQLRCAGIVSTVGEVYPETTDELPLEQFFSDHQISEYTYNLEDGPSQGWIEFSCDDYHVWINTNDSGASSDDSAKAATMKRSYTVIIIDEEIAKDNYSIPYKYRNDYKAVLRGEMEFRDTISGKSFDISRVQEAITSDTSMTIQPDYFAVVDLDADDTAEVIVSLVINGSSSYGSLVLRWQDGVVYGYLFSEREFSDVRTDGTFWSSGGASDVGICKITFDKDTYSIDRFTYSLYRPSDDSTVYFVDHQETTEEEWNLALSQWREIPCVQWYALADDKIEAVLP